MLFNVLLYALMIFMIFRMITTNRIVNRRRKVINVLRQVADEQAFFEAADQLIQSESDPVIQAKTKVIRLWGLVYHNRMARFEEQLNELDINPLFTEKKGMINIEGDEDSFFYLLLAIPNMLYGHGEIEMIDKVMEKVSTYSDKLEGQMNLAVAENCVKYYKKEDDLGETFFRNVDAGEYPGFRYSKQLIGIYKNICDTMLCRILADRNEDYSEFEVYAQNFANTGIGERWIKALGLDIKAPGEETQEEVETAEEVAEETEVPQIEQKEQPEPEIIDVEATVPEEEKVPAETTEPEVIEAVAEETETAETEKKEESE
jgi:hypothetical protein